jgi:hypothetical protein
MLPGCSFVGRGGAPEMSFDINKDLKELTKHFDQAAAISEFYKNPTREARDEFITARLVLTNIRYLQFIRDITSEKQLIDSASEMTVLSLNLAGAAVSGVDTKTVLSTTAAAVTGSKAIIDKNYYFEKTIPALVAAMNAERKKALVPILLGMKKDLQHYLFCDAVTDLHYYYYAGTFSGAIQAIQSDAGVKEQKQDEQIKVAKLVPMTEGDIDLKVSLTQAIGKLQPQDLDKVKNALSLLDADSAAPPADIEEAKSQLQRHVRNAKDPERIKELDAVFKKSGIR